MQLARTLASLDMPANRLVLEVTEDMLLGDEQLAAQTLAMALYAYFVTFRVMGRNYDAAVLVAGICGFGLGATPNAMANMSAVCYKYHYTVKPFLIVPIIGAMFVDLINTGFITMFLNWIGA